MICMSWISLFSTRPKLDNFCAKKYYFWFISFSKILVASPVAFTNAESFQAIVGRRQNELRKAVGLIGLFSHMKTEFLKSCIICSRTISVFVCKISVYFSAPSLSASAPPTLFALATALL